jgi:uncharacterized glyoxalase superfamily protein PhnB
MEEHTTMAKITPEIAVSNMESSLRFYYALGFQKMDDGIIDEFGSQWSNLALGEANLWLIRQDVVEDFQQDTACGNGVNIYIAVDDIDTLYDTARTSGLQMNIVKEIETMWYGLRQFTVADPDGYILTINMPVATAEGGEKSNGEG